MLSRTSTRPAPPNTEERHERCEKDRIRAAVGGLLVRNYVETAMAMTSMPKTIWNAGWKCFQRASGPLELAVVNTASCQFALLTGRSSKSELMLSIVGRPDS
jgi:hypothetical protein